VNGSFSDSYHVNGLRSPVTNTSLYSKKLHQHADGHGTAVATEFSRTASKQSDGNKNRKNAVVSLDDFVSCLLFAAELCSAYFHFVEVLKMNF